MADLFTLVAVIDVETTGFPPDAAMVEVGRTNVRLYPDGWRIESGPVSAFVDPCRPIPPEVSAIHHIVAADCAGSMSQAEAVHWATVGADFVCAHNAEFDAQFVRPTRLPWLCTLKGARNVWPDLISHANQAVRYARGLCQSVEERNMVSHRAAADTWVTAHILIDILNNLPVERLAEISQAPSRLLRMPFGKHKGSKFSELPWDYISWIINKSDLGEDIKFSARAEQKRRADA